MWSAIIICTQKDTIYYPGLVINEVLHIVRQVLKASRIKSCHILHMVNPIKTQVEINMSLIYQYIASNDMIKFDEKAYNIGIIYVVCVW